MTDLQKIGALLGVLVVLVVWFAISNSNLVGSVTAVYAVASGIALGRILVRHEPDPDEPDPDEVDGAVALDPDAETAPEHRASPEVEPEADPASDPA